LVWNEKNGASPRYVSIMGYIKATKTETANPLFNRNYEIVAPFCHVSENAGFLVYHTYI
jgi:hypothetical protein